MLLSFLFVQKYNKLSVVNEQERPPMYVLTVKHDKSVGLTDSRVKTDIEPIISLVFSAWEHIKSVKKNRQSHDDAVFNQNQIYQLEQRFRFRVAESELLKLLVYFIF